MSERQGQIRNYIAGLRWAGLREDLYNVAVKCRLELEVTDYTHGWLRETIFFTVRGSESNLRSFLAIFKQWALETAE